MKRETETEKSLPELRHELLLAQSTLLKEIAKNMESNNLSLTSDFRQALANLQSIDSQLQFATYREAVKARGGEER